VIALGVNVVGYLDAVLGQGESARRFCDGLDAVGIPWKGFALRLPVERARTQTTTQFGTAPFPYRVSVLWCNPDRYGIDINVDDPLTRRRYTIGRWAWEVDVVPDEWRLASRRLDEIWVASEFVARLLRGRVDAPIAVVPPAIAAGPAVRPLARSSLGIPDGTFVFLCSFDYHSAIARKNPAGAIAAFRTAFGPRDGAALIVKSVNAASRPRDAEALRRAAAGREDVHFLDAALLTADRDRLLAACDCYVSLHRSEGFGLGLAEATAFARPVIATAYGGNLDFMDGPDALLVRCLPAQVGPGSDPYPVGATWAEPSIEHAAALMRLLAADPAAAAARGRVAAARFAKRFAPAAAGATAALHVERARAALARRDAVAGFGAPSRLAVGGARKPPAGA
jgi:glycosyltransferase involved in cell wall biosynthesis